MKQSGSIISSASSPEEIDEGTDVELEGESRLLDIPPALHGKRLDHALVELVPEFSRSYLQQLIDAGLVRLNGSVAGKSSFRVKAGDHGTIELKPTPQSQAFKPETMPLDVIFSDAHLLVIDKPAGLVVHPAPGNWSGTLLNGLLAFDPMAAALPRAGIVHRLDKDTSGLMVVARTRAVMDSLVQMIAARHVSRQYLALTAKKWSGSATREINLPIGRDPRNRLRMAVVDLARNAGKSAHTTCRLIDASASAALVLCTLHTGRTHQIRVHMASIGLPLVADTLYGGQLGGGLTRQGLHARHLAFTHPVTGTPMHFMAPMPKDFLAALGNLSLRYNEG